tara:strand:- start:97 stop:258 length:162 start_codon:yes stop_codon:yes gene_type:complete
VNKNELKALIKKAFNPPVPGPDDDPVISQEKINEHIASNLADAIINYVKSTEG